MRRYSSMTSIYSMSTANCNLDDYVDSDDDDGGHHSSSSKEYITPSTDSQSEGFKNDDTPPQNRHARPTKIRSLSHDE